MNNSELEQRAAKLEQENQSLKAQLGTATAAQNSWRKFGSWSLLSLSLISLVVASFLVWANRTIIDPDRYIATVGPVIQQPAVQKAITTNVSDKLFSQNKVEDRVAQILPPNADFLAGPIASQIKTQTTNLIGRVVSGDRFYNVWIATNQKAQAAFVKVATSGRTSPVININDIYQFISTQLQDTRLSPLLNKQLPASVGNVQVTSVPWLPQISHYMTVLNRWVWWSVILTFGLAALAVLVAAQRPLLVKRLGIGWIGVAIVSFVIIHVVRGIVLGHISGQVNQDAAEAIWQTMVHYLYIQLEVTAIAGVAFATTGWFLGTSSLAIRARTASEGTLAKLRSQLLDVEPDNSTLKFLRSHRRGLEWLVLGLTLAALLLLIPLSVPSIIWVIIGGLAGLFIVELLVSPDAPISPSGGSQHSHKT